MIQMISVIIDKKSIEVDPIRERIISNIYFRVDDKVFPDEGWTDFTVIILGWWLEELSQLEINKRRSSFKLNFMDGPLFVSGLIEADNTVNLEFAKERLARKEVFFQAKCELSQLKLAVLDAANGLIKELSINRIDNNDVKKLKGLITLIEWNIFIYWRGR